MPEAGGPKKAGQREGREALSCNQTDTTRPCKHELRFKLSYEKCMAAKCPRPNHQDQTAAGGDGVTSQSENSLNFVNVGNVIPFPLAQNVHLAVAQVPLIIPISPPYQASSIECSGTI